MTSNHQHSTVDLLLELDEVEQLFLEKQKKKEESMVKREEKLALTEEEKKAEKSKKAAEAQMRKALNRMVITFAELGDIEGIKKCCDKGATLEKARDRGMSVLGAAASTGQKEVALWLLDQPGINPAQHNNSSVLNDLIRKDQVEVLKKLFEKFPEMSSSYNMDGCLSNVGRYRAPQCFEYLMGQYPDALKKKASSYYNSEPLTGALIHHSDNKSLCEFHFNFLKNRAEKDFELLFNNVISNLISEDCAEGLIFLLKKEPERLMKMATLTSQAYGPLRHVEYNFQSLNSQAQSNFFKDPSSRFNQFKNGKLAMPFLAALAKQGARNCFQVLSGLKVFSEPLKTAFENKETMYWEGIYACAHNLDSYNWIKKTGFDFTNPMPDGGNYFHLSLMSQNHTKGLWEKLGQDLSELMDRKDGFEEAPFQLVVKNNCWFRSDTEKLRAIAEKHALKKISKTPFKRKPKEEPVKRNRL